MGAKERVGGGVMRFGTAVPGRCEGGLLTGSAHERRVTDEGSLSARYGQNKERFVRLDADSRGVLACCRLDSALF